MRTDTVLALINARAEFQKLPFYARPFAGAVMAVLECLNKEQEAKSGN